MSRHANIDLVKAIASQAIVLHHMVLYMPMVPVLSESSPELIEWLDQHGRLAVQFFLVIAGYLAHHTLTAINHIKPTDLIAKRFVRLAVMLWIALLMVVLSSLIFGHWLEGRDWLSPIPSPGVFAAHMLFLQDMLGIPSISAGAWYVAIDMQLFSLSVVLVWLSHRYTWINVLPGWSLPAALVLLSALWWSQDNGLDVWALYFYASYGLGWLAAHAHANPRDKVYFWLVVLVVAATGIFSAAIRPVLASAFAIALVLCQPARRPSTFKHLEAFAQQLSKRSYALFVTHYAWIIVFSGLWVWLERTDLPAAFALFALTWLTANLAAKWLDPIGNRLVQALTSQRAG